MVAKNKKSSNRLTVLKLPVGESETTWLVRIEPGYSEFWLNILRGRPDTIKIYHVSSSDAWRTIFTIGGEKVKALQPALRISFPVL